MTASRTATLLVLANEARGLFQVSAHGGPMVEAARAGDFTILGQQALLITIAGAAVWLALRLIRRTANV